MFQLMLKDIMIMKFMQVWIKKKYDLVAKKSDTSWNTPQGDTYVFNDTFTAHYIKVKILKTHAENQPNNNTGHIKEL